MSVPRSTRLNALLRRLDDDDGPVLASTHPWEVWGPAQPAKPKQVVRAKRKPKRKRPTGTERFLAALKGERLLVSTVGALASGTVNRAVAAGTLLKPDACTRCGNVVPPSKLQGHHADYAKPLDVEWLCVPCHSRHHVALRRAARS